MRKIVVGLGCASLLVLGRRFSRVALTILFRSRFCFVRFRKVMSSEIQLVMLPLQKDQLRRRYEASMLRICRRSEGLGGSDNSDNYLVDLSKAVLNWLQIYVPRKNSDTLVLTPKRHQIGQTAIPEP